jgi:hypothetical protein
MDTITTVQPQAYVPMSQRLPIKLHGYYEFDRNIWSGKTTVCKLLRRSGSETIIDQMLSLNKTFKLKKYKLKRNWGDQLYFLSAQDNKQCLGHSISLNWDESKGIATGFSKDRNENIVVLAEKDSMGIFVFDNEPGSLSRMERFWGIGAIKFVKGFPDFEISRQMNELELQAVTVA